MNGGRIWRVLLATVVLAGVTAPVADAYLSVGKRWPGRTARITYWNGTTYRAELAAAVRAWNNSGARVRFVRSSRARANLRITASDPRNDGGFGAHGLASVGFRPRSFVKLSRGSRSGAAITGVIAHELGHVLGLGHEDGTCSVLNSVPWSRCQNDRPCEILQLDDLRGAVHRYGGRIRPARGELCPPAPPAPTIDFIPGSYRAQARFRMPNALSVAGYAISVGLGSCPTDPAASAPSGQARAGQDVTVDVTPFQDPHGADGKLLCARVWSLGEGGRVSVRPSTAQATYKPDPLPPPSGLTLLRASDGFTASWSLVSHQQIRSYDLTWQLGETCPARPEDVQPIQRRTVLHPISTVRIGLVAGRYCVAIFARDRFDVASADATTAVVDVG